MREPRSGLVSELNAGHVSEQSPGYMREPSAGHVKKPSSRLERAKFWTCEKSQVLDMRESSSGHST